MVIKKKSDFASIVEAIIKNDAGEILLLKRSNHNTFFTGLWQLAGGKVEFGENIESAVKREIFEETGCNCINSKLEKVFSFYEEFNGFKGTLFLMVYSCEINDSIKLSKDHDEFGFFSMTQIKKMKLAPISKKAIFG
ncbi:MAG: NUDIX domain-containing protein [Candidatus ainarchaeum sp.]|nr:NUDIX domain-containing protein [Candidatus ainarchaeum sp.]